MIHSKILQSVKNVPQDFFQELMQFVRIAPLGMFKMRPAKILAPSVMPASILRKRKRIVWVVLEDILVPSDSPLAFYVMLGHTATRTILHASCVAKDYGAINQEHQITIHAKLARSVHIPLPKVSQA